VGNSHSGWQTGIAVAGGVSTAVYLDCIGGNPLRAGIEGGVRFFLSLSISVPSISFLFAETGSTGHTTDHGAMLNFSVPIIMAR
jgi:hypothetical protein